MYDLTKVVLAGGEHRLSRWGGVGAGRWRPEAGPGAGACLTLSCTPGVAPALFRGMPAHFSDSAQTEACYHMLSRPQPPPDPALLQRLPRPSSLLDKTQLHSRCAAGQLCGLGLGPRGSGLPLPGPLPSPGSLPQIPTSSFQACLMSVLSLHHSPPTSPLPPPCPPPRPALPLPWP